MSKREKLEQILDLETSHAEDGCQRSRGLVINAQAELDALNRREFAMRQSQWQDEEEHKWGSDERNWGVEPEDA